MTAMILLTTTIGVSAQDAEVTEEEPQATEEQAEAEQNNKYVYVAQPGDSYTLMARKAVQTLGLQEEVDLSPAQIIFAESNLTKEANAGQLEIGQQVEISVETVRKWVEAAEELSVAQVQAWQPYAQYADFNTDHVGEESSS